MPNLFITLQKLVPQHLLSRIVGRVAESSRLKTPFISWFAKRYEVDMSEAQEQDPLAYENFIAFLPALSKPMRDRLPKASMMRCRFYAPPMAR